MRLSGQKHRYGSWASVNAAPKDGTEILCFTKYGDYEISHWERNVQCWVSKRGFLVEPTRWTPLPKAPDESGDSVMPALVD
jgi:hypothetical protein